MKRHELNELVREAVKEVITEVIIAPVDKDPEQMNPDEKKQAAAQVRQSAGTDDQDLPVDLIKREQKLREMPRTAITYKLGDNPEEKLKQVNPKWLASPSRMRWMQGIIDYIKEKGPSDITTIAKDKFNVPQPMLADYGRELIKAGVLVPAGMKGKDDVDATKITPQFLRKHIDKDSGEEMPSGPKKINKALGKGGDAEDMFVGGGFDDDFSKDTLGGGDDDTDDLDMEPDLGEPDKMDFKSHISPEDMEILMDVDDLVSSIKKIKDALSKLKGFRRGGMGEISTPSSEEDKSRTNLEAILAKKRAKLQAILDIHGDLIAKYRPELAKLVNRGSSNPEVTPPNIEPELEEEEMEDEIMAEDTKIKERFQKLANIKK